MKVGIIGGGPAGIAAAIAIKQNSPKCQVYIIEKQDKIGGKIPLTGNGRCNISNISISTSNYYFDNNFENNIASILKDFDISAMKKLLLSAGILTIEEDGRIYPASGKASQVRDGLEALVKELEIQLICSCECCDIIKEDSNKIKVFYKNRNNVKASIIVDKLVLATGSPASQKRITDNNSIYLAKKCELLVEDFFPALTGYICDDSYDKSLTGVRAKARISCEDFCEYGEVQFTEEGISGIPTFQLSLYIGKRIINENIKISIDFLYGVSDSLIDEWKDNNKNKKYTTIEELLSGLVNPKVANVVLKKCNILPSIIASTLNYKQLEAVIYQLHNYSLTLKAIKTLSQAQVALGGLKLDNFDNKLQVIDQCGLFSCGEILDIAGRCGGFNLHFAFASGWRVGAAIAKTSF